MEFGHERKGFINPYLGYLRSSWLKNHLRLSWDDPPRNGKSQVHLEEEWNVTPVIPRTHGHDDHHGNSLETSGWIILTEPDFWRFFSLWVFPFKPYPYSLLRARGLLHFRYLKCLVIVAVAVALSSLPSDSRHCCFQIAPHQKLRSKYFITSRVNHKIYIYNHLVIY